MSEIYSLLNDVKTDLDSYKKENLTDMEIAKLKKKVHQNLKKKRNFNGILKVACAVFVISLEGGALFGNEIAASAKSIAWKISNLLGIDKNLQDYATVLNTSKSDNGYTITLNEVILDEKNLLVSTTIKGEKKLTNNVETVGDVYINGKQVSLACGYKDNNLNDYMVESVSDFELSDDIDTQKELEIEIVYNQIGFGDDSVKGNWKFRFVTDGSNLAADTIHIPLNTDFELENGATIHLTEYTSNKLGEKIYFAITGVSESECADYDMKLEGQDNLKNKVKFYLSYMKGDKGKGCFEISTPGNGVRSDASSIVLIPYAVKLPESSGQLSHDFEKTGKEIIINLNK